MRGEHADLVLLQFGGGEAFGVGQGLLALIVREDEPRLDFVTSMEYPKTLLKRTFKEWIPVRLATNLLSRGHSGEQAGPFTDADVEYALSSLPAASATMEPGQRNRSRRFATRFGTLYTHVMTGPPTWWLPRVKRDKDGALMAGWLRLAVAVKLARG